MQADGFFRVRVPPSNFQRVFKPRWGDAIHTVRALEGFHVEDLQGKRYLTKLTQPIPTPTESTEPSALERGGSASAEARKRRVLEELARNAVVWLGERAVTFSQLGVYLNTQGFRQAALAAGLTQKSPVLAFVRAFPERFSLRSEGSATRVFARRRMAYPGARRLVRTG